MLSDAGLSQNQNPGTDPAKHSRPQGRDRLFEIGRSAFKPLAFLAFGHVPYLAALKEGLHLDFAPARTEKLLRRAGGSAVLTGLGHTSLLAG